MDIDGLLNAKPASGSPPPPGAALGAEISQSVANAIDDPEFGQNLPMPVSLDLNAVTVTLGGQILTDVTAGVKLHTGAPIDVKFDGKGPGRSQISLAGTLETGAGAIFRGHASGSLAEPSQFAAWLKPALPNLAAHVAALPVSSLSVAGDMAISGRCSDENCLA